MRSVIDYARWSQRYETFYRDLVERVIWELSECIPETDG